MKGKDYQYFVIGMKEMGRLKERIKGRKLILECVCPMWRE